MGWGNGAAGNGICCKAVGPERDPRVLHGGSHLPKRTGTIWLLTGKYSDGHTALSVKRDSRNTLDLHL